MKEALKEQKKTMKLSLRSLKADKEGGTMDLWKDIELNDIPEEQRDFAELVGLDTFRRLVEMYGGSSIYICKEEAILRKRRNEEIVKEFNGYNYLELAKKHNITERSVRDIINVALGSRKYVTKNQVSMFDDT